MSGKITWLYAVRDKVTGEFISKSVGNPIYVRQADATKKMNNMNGYAKRHNPDRVGNYEVVVTEVNFRPIA